MTVKIGIIGGSGLENPELFQNPQDIQVSTPWGGLPHHSNWEKLLA